MPASLQPPVLHHSAPPPETPWKRSSTTTRHLGQDVWLECQVGLEFGLRDPRQKDIGNPFVMCMRSAHTHTYEPTYV